VVRVKLALWYNEIEEFGYDTFTTVANSIENHYERILNYFVNRRTNAAAEAFNAKIKAFKASFCGVVDKRFFLYGLQRSMHKGELAKINPPRIITDSLYRHTLHKAGLPNKKAIDLSMAFLFGSPWGNRTPLSRMKILRPNR
jgi:hypothetical protein